jgi:hypothetical protein
MSQKEQFDRLFSSLFENKIIYHERITVLCKVNKYEATEDRFEVWLRPLRPLFLSNFEHMYHRLLENGEFCLGAVFDFNGWRLFDGKRIGHPYCPFTLWPTTEVVQRICRLTEPIPAEMVHRLLWEA